MLKRAVQRRMLQMPHNEQDGPLTKRAGSGVNIASEEPMFGKHGYRPLPKMSQANYANTDAYASVYTTTTKAVRMAHEPKKILPSPAKRVAVFGCTSFQGSRIAKKLVESPEYDEVRLCTRYPDQIPEDLQKIININPEKCFLEATNVLDKPSINRALEGVDSIVNAIDMRNDDFYNLHVDVHVKGSSNIAYQARLRGIKRYIYISGLDAIWGNDSDRSDFRAKAEEMALAESFFAVVLKPGHLYGSGYRYSNFGKQWYPTVFPDTKLQPTWVNDLADATHKVLQTPEIVKKIIDLGGPKIMTHMQFAAERAAHMKGPKPFPCPMWLGDACAFVNEFLTPRPMFNRSMLCEMEMDQTARPKELNPYAWDWEELGLKPADIQTAAAREKEGQAF